MVSTSYSAVFEGATPRLIEVQCAVAPGLPAFNIVGLPDKAVTEARDRIRASLAAMHVSLPSKKITVNLAPADLPKSGAQFDLPIALSILAAIGAIPEDRVSACLSLGELSLTGQIVAVSGAMPAGMLAAQNDKVFFCAEGMGTQAAWVNPSSVFEAGTLSDIVRHFSGDAPLAAARAIAVTSDEPELCLSDVRGQEKAKRALEIAAAGHHHMVMIGPPGAGKTLLAQRLPGIMPPLTAEEMLQASMLHSVGPGLPSGGLMRDRAFCAPHHSASMAAMVGGGKHAGPGQISLAHHGVLFLDELPEFARDVLDALRQPLESRSITVSRAQHSHTYPADFLLVAAANPCRCGYLSDPGRACSQAPKCGQKYLSKISGPLLDRIDIQLEIPPVSFQDLQDAPKGERSKTVAGRVAAARDIQTERFKDHPDVAVNAHANGDLLQHIATPTADGRDLLRLVDSRFGLSARGYHRLLRMARTIADLDGDDVVDHPHLAEAVAYRIARSEAMPLG